jgi:hypothetical protein
LVGSSSFAIGHNENQVVLRSGWRRRQVAAAAVLSTGVTKDLDSCRRDVLAFLRMLRWRVISVEVRLWTDLGLRAGTREWGADGVDYETLAEGVARFITGGEAETGAIVLARRSPDTNPRRP